MSRRRRAKKPMSSKGDVVYAVRKVTHETSGAWLCRLAVTKGCSDIVTWFPKSQCKLMGVVGGTLGISVPEWLVLKKVVEQFKLLPEDLKTVEASRCYRLEKSLSGIPVPANLHQTLRKERQNGKIEKEKRQQSTRGHGEDPKRS